MKKLFALFAALAITAGSVPAQNVSAKTDGRWGFGVLTGVNRSFPRFSTLFARSDAKKAWLFGVDIHYQLGGRSSVHIQPLLTRFSNLKDDDGWQTPIISLTTLKIPVLYRHYILPTRRWFFVEAGAAYNTVADSDYRERLFITCIVAPCPSPLGEQQNPVTRSAVSLMGGIGVDIPLQKITIPVTLRYERYISNYQFSGKYDGNYRTSVSFENVSLTTGVNF